MAANTDITASTTVVLITGGNQGLGYEAIKQLVAKHPDWHIILSGRRPDAVKEATESFAKDGHLVYPLTMDIDSDESITVAAAHVTETFGHLDILINNSAITASGVEPPRQRMLDIFNTNVAGSVLVTDAFLPLLSKSQQTKRVIFVSSALASMSRKIDPSLQSPFRLVQSPYYSASKSALNMIALHYAVTYEKDKSWKFVISDPGYYLKTNLDKFQGFEEPAKGAVATVKLCDLTDEDPSGTFTDDRGTVEW